METQSNFKGIKCINCGSKNLVQEKGEYKKKCPWQQVVLLVCQKCGFIHMFRERNDKK